MSSRIIQVVSKLSMSRIGVMVVLVFLTGCVASTGPTKTSIQLQAFQSKEFETTKKIAFASTMSVFQDLGYTIGTADLETGFITAKSPTKQSFVPFVGQKMEDVKATAFVEAMGGKISKIRLNFVNSTQTSSGYGMKGENEKPIEDPKVYQETFTKIAKAIFVRESIGE